jgi:hypothetical protein
VARLFTGLEVIQNWSPLDDAPAPDFTPAEWNGPHVQKCLADAWKTLGHLPAGNIWPKGFANCWPRYRIEWFDLLALVGAGVQEVEAFYRQMNRTRTLPTSKEISRMEKALVWPLEYLAGPRQCLIVNVCAKVMARYGELGDVLQREIKRRRYRGHADHWQRLNWKYCDKIADGLIKDKEVVF